MEAVLPSNVNYLDTLPRGVPAERKRKNFFAANGTQYRPGQTAIIEISDPRCFLDPVNSFLRFSVSLDAGAAGTFCTELGGGYGFLKNFRIQQAGNTIMNIQEYSRLYCGIIALLLVVVIGKHRLLFIKIKHLMGLHYKQQVRHLIHRELRSRLMEA